MDIFITSGFGPGTDGGVRCPCGAHEFHWSPSTTTTYSAGSVVIFKEATFYALQSKNKNLVPTTSPAYWQAIGDGGNTVS